MAASLQSKTREIISKVAEEYNLPEFVVEEVMMSQFRFLRDTIKTARENQFPTVLFQKLGKFKVSNHQIAQLQITEEIRRNRKLKKALEDNKENIEDDNREQETN
jgi:hypothetical protein